MKGLYAEDFVRYVCHLADEVPTVYLFGGMGDFVTPELIEEKAAKYPKWYTAERRACIDMRTPACGALTAAAL